MASKFTVYSIAHSRHFIYANNIFSAPFLEVGWTYTVLFFSIFFFNLAACVVRSLHFTPAGARTACTVPTGGASAPHSLPPEFYHRRYGTRKLRPAFRDVAQFSYGYGYSRLYALNISSASWYKIRLCLMSCLVHARTWSSGFKFDPRYGSL